jgi:hypothetical protein
MNLTQCRIKTKWRRWNRHLMELLIFDFRLLLHISSGLKTDENNDVIFEVRGWRCTSLQFLWGMTSLLFIKVYWHAWLVKLRFFPNTHSFKVMSLTKRKASLGFAKYNINICNRNHNSN